MCRCCSLSSLPCFGFCGWHFLNLNQMDFFEIVKNMTPWTLLNGKQSLLVNHQSVTCTSNPSWQTEVSQTLSFEDLWQVQINLSWNVQRKKKSFVSYRLFYSCRSTQTGRVYLTLLFTKRPPVIFQKKSEGRREKGSWMKKARKMKTIESPPEAKMWTLLKLYLLVTSLQPHVLFSPSFILQ